MMPDLRTISVGVIGTGGMGTRHVVNLHQHVSAVRVAAVYDFDHDRARQAAALCGSATVFDDPLHLIQADAVDAVLIASPDETHVDFVLECLRQRKPVLCEKPLATTAADAAKIVAAEGELGRRLVAVGFMRRFDPQHLAVRHVVESGTLGRAIMFKGVHRNATIQPHVTAAGVVISSASHDIDTARWLLGQEVIEVFVYGVRTRPSFSDATRDMLLVQMSLSGDCVATMEVFVAAEYGYEVAAEIVAERGTAVTMQPDYALVRSQQTRSVPVPHDWLTRFQAAYVAELTDWARSMQTERAFAGASAWDGYMSLLATDACIASLRSGAPVPVALPDKPSLYATMTEV
jgi:myo-inositol 2-dehydrogenase/D-chiro-inositol 1-dehydrogenase